MKDMNSKIKEIRTPKGVKVDQLWQFEDLTPIEIFFRDGSREINCTPYPFEEPEYFYTDHAAVVHATWRECNEKKWKFLLTYEYKYSIDHPLKYWARKVALKLNERGQENKRFTINKDSLEENSDFIRIAMPGMCAASFKCRKQWLRKSSGWYGKVKINTEI